MRSSTGNGSPPRGTLTSCPCRSPRRPAMRMAVRGMTCPSPHRVNCRTESRARSRTPEVIPCTLAAGLGHCRGQPIEQLGLPLDELGTGGLEVEPGGAIDLGKLLDAAGARRPLELEHVAHDRVGVEVALDGPRGHTLAVGLPHLAEFEITIVRRRGAEFLGELAASRDE